MPNPLLIDNDDRYSRFRLIDWWEQERLTRAKIMVVGAGALGNEVLKNFALLGVGHVYVVDFDRIETSNLTRSVLYRARDRGRLKAEAAVDAMLDINPDMQAIPLPVDIMTDIGLGLFREMDVVIGCLDNREARLWVNRCCWKVNTPWIDGGIQEINGVAKVFQPPDGACYECAMTENDYRLINVRYSCPQLRREEVQRGQTPTTPTIASIIGGLQTQEALKLLHDLPVSSGQAMVFNGVTNQFYKSKFQHREDCLSHETYGPPVELALSAETNTAADLFAAAAPSFAEGAALQLLLDRDLLISFECQPCKTSRAAMKPLLSVSAEENSCPTCGEPCSRTVVHCLQQDSELAGETLSRLGIPRYDIVRLMSVSQDGENAGESALEGNDVDEKCFLLVGDRDTSTGTPKDATPPDQHG